MKPKWLNKNTKHFIDDNNTEFIKGPFNIDDNEYAYKLKDSNGEDYCSVEQMILWGIIMIKDLTGDKK